ncbi:hypothetical protein K439DRAFT_1636212 [Ramaria rubella]|nr:hypothetical protein K439DRAFT_1636212 [Ramaria rubella]
MSQHRHSHTTNAGSPDVQGPRTFTTYPPQHGAHMSPNEVNFGGVQRDARNTLHMRGPNQSVRAQDSSSQLSPHPSAPPSFRRHYAHISQPEQLNPSHNPQQRHPSLSLDTRNLHTPHNHHPSPLPPSRPTLDSPTFSSSEPTSPLHSDLMSLKSGLESLWNLSSKQLHILHSTLHAQTENLRNVNISNSRLESSLAQQQATHSREAERLGAENYRIIKEGREAEEARRKALREREMLSVANARLWEDKARLEGEKRELRVKLDAEAEFARLCQQQCEVGKKPGPSNGITIKMEEEGGDASGGDDASHIPLAQVEEIIERRLKIQADEFTHEVNEVYEKLARSQTRVTELEALLKRSSYNTTIGEPGGVAPSIQPSHHSANEIKSGRTSPIPSPMTPHTALPSSMSETDREFPFVKPWGVRKTSDPAVQTGTTMSGGEPIMSTGSRDRSHHILRTVSGPVESNNIDMGSEAPRRRVSVPTYHSKLGSGPVPHSSPTINTPIVDALHMRKKKGPPKSPSPSDVHEQIVRTYVGVGAGWKPAPPLILPQPKVPHPRPATPSDRPAKRAKTEELQQDTTDGETQRSNRDVKMQTPSRSPLSPHVQLPPEDEQAARNMTPDERLMFSSLCRVLAKRKDGDGWKCVRCRQEKKSPTAIFGETTPIGVVTNHVKDAHKQFWKDLKGDKAAV